MQQHWLSECLSIRRRGIIVHRMMAIQIFKIRISVIRPYMAVKRGYSSMIVRLRLLCLLIMYHSVTFGSDPPQSQSFIVPPFATFVQRTGKIPKQDEGLHHASDHRRGEHQGQLAEAVYDIVRRHHKQDSKAFSFMEGDDGSTKLFHSQTPMHLNQKSCHRQNFSFSAKDTFREMLMKPTPKLDSSLYEKHT